ncbi:hypothetical protein GII30_15905 [Gordonia amarae]|uniref:Uncharacterized protein n=2 Tax=Gordonia amarae TaxID=36821 RepID=G7GVH1_9ACTN|nr:hypothetical protein [Gordonia amarae]MCS3879892.1 hypothetical protein [Gordonia amarae]QHN18302.1 hypothetical protein GII35_16220 [Gordonia amarae]QHN22785.1 hypothetical protein GII34_15760 [Gordonia amarae]QHN31689.1 hypothetical protein GII32_16070 [Gordonia amarae]QHN40433.1 hypothetical protein GII30_15905 [Gordonia amarae]
MEGGTHTRNPHHAHRTDAADAKGNAMLGEMFRALVEEAARQWLPRRGTRDDQADTGPRPEWSPYRTTSYEVPKLEPLRNPADVSRRPELRPLDGNRLRDPADTTDLPASRKLPRERRLPPL